MSIVRLKNVEKAYGNFFALKNINLELEKGAQYVVQGSSGSGKSTLLYLIGGLDSPSKGDIFFEDIKLTDFNDEELARYRNRNVGFVFQFHFLLPSLNNLDNILLPAKIGGSDLKEIKDFSGEMAALLGVSDCLKKFPFELSGGEQQRINIIRALSLSPTLLLCDEPTGNLDSKNSMLVTEILQSLARERGSTLVVVTHDQEVAKCFKEKISISDGQIESTAPPIPVPSSTEKSL